ncbi:Tcm62p Ecym_4757 [Eremothecium cymbalariae DBVPG|uniref:Mitochondrial chaperone TCM62 n=1 Tax=Eremothecium cymbalariae (strain CBS 270.75 / DBVPG 7215 / KCTC 17166 / NRRL Y-17582) TaxID=931890 RepID=G8JSP8_ERECY|nr:hypothetical protein Ecym_4757 [Eremothecium cymbalariae DBVPG\
MLVRKGFIRGVQTLHTPILNTNHLSTRQGLLHHIRLLDDVLNRTSYNKTLLFEGKYKRLPSFITSRDTVRLENVIREFTDGLQMAQALDTSLQLNPNEKLGKIGLQLFMECHRNMIVPTSTSLTISLMNEYNKYPSKETLDGILRGIRKVYTHLDSHKFHLKEPADIDSLVDRLAFSQANAATVKNALRILNYELYSDDKVRVVRGRKTSDEIEVSKGWKYAAGIPTLSDAYTRSLDLHNRKLVSINEPSLVLVYDGTLRDANKILPTLHYAFKEEKPVLLIVNGEIVGDALTAITIHNNKSKRNKNASTAVILRYIARDHNGLHIQENYNLINFLKLPRGVGSIYNPEFCDYVPSKQTAKHYFGSIESIKATSGECFLYNDNHDGVDNPALRSTVTIYVGGTSEVEIDRRRAIIDNIINQYLCHGLSKGFVPTFGIALAKCIGPISQLGPDYKDTRMVLESLALPMENAIRNLYGISNYEVSKIVSDTILDPRFSYAILPSGSTNTISKGYLEPWSFVENALTGVSSFLSLLNSCDLLVSCIFDKPKRRH